MTGVQTCALPIVAVTRRVSVGSIVGAAAFPFGVWIILHPPMQFTAAAFLAGAFIIYRHKSNWQRLRAGTEAVFSWSRQ